MSAGEVIGCIWVLLTVISFAFDRYIMTNNSTAGRSTSREQIEEEVAAYTGVPHTSAHTVLGVSPTATQEEIKTAYRRLAMKHHPDRGGSQAEFQKVKTAYEQLMKPTRCPLCGGKGTTKVKRGAFVDTIQCPRCWPSKEGEK